jgi:hypothetical protein
MWTDLTHRADRRDGRHDEIHTMGAEWSVLEQHMSPHSASAEMRGRWLPGCSVDLSAWFKQ